MKTEEAVVNIPRWANWVAKDADGYKSFHENEPSLGVDRWVSLGQKILVDGIAYNPSGWKSSLQKIIWNVND